MYLSQLLIDTGGDPDRYRPGRMWLNNIYNVHRRLSMAFPMRLRRDADREFLKPYDPADFAKRQFLFRVDNDIDGNSQRAVVIIQSTVKPDWDWAFQNASHFLAAPPQVIEYNPIFKTGQELHFRILMNLSVKRNVEEVEESAFGKTKTGRILHKRVAFTWNEDTTPDDAIGDWFAGKAVAQGFCPIRTRLLNLAWVYGSKSEATGMRPRRENVFRKLKYRSALLEGILRVDDPVKFTAALKNGIGSAKSMGFGLLSVRPV